MAGKNSIACIVHAERCVGMEVCVRRFVKDWFTEAPRKRQREEQIVDCYVGVGTEPGEVQSRGLWPTEISIEVWQASSMLLSILESSRYALAILLTTRMVRLNVCCRCAGVRMLEACRRVVMEMPQAYRQEGMEVWSSEGVLQA